MFESALGTFKLLAPYVATFLFGVFVGVMMVTAALTIPPGKD